MQSHFVFSKRLGNAAAPSSRNRANDRNACCSLRTAAIEMDYAEEQAQELEALEAILMDDLQGLIPAQNARALIDSCYVSSHPAAAAPP